MCSIFIQYFYMKIVEVWEIENFGRDVRLQINSIQVGFFFFFTEGGQVYIGYFMFYCVCVVKINICNVVKLLREVYYVIIKILLYFYFFY